MQAEYVKEDNKNSKDGKIYGTVIAVFDENNICISSRIVEKGYDNYYLDNRIEKMNSPETKSFGNYKIINDEEHYNINTWNGLKRMKLYNIGLKNIVI